MEVKLWSVMASTLAVASIMLLVKLLNWAWFRPKKLEKFLRSQGLRGNPYTLLMGDMKDFITSTKTEQTRILQLSDDVPSHILPFYHNIIHKYGNKSFSWFGPSPNINVADPELIKEILAKPAVYQKPRPNPIGETVVGGLIFLEEDEWTRRRKIINSAFHMEKLKNMIPAMHLSCSNMLRKWEEMFSSNEKKLEIDVWPYLEDLSGDVISKTAFGSIHEEGRRIFELQREQVKLVLQLLQYIFIPGFSYLPTKENRRMKAINREIQSLLRGIIDQRERAMDRGEIIKDDLLGALMESSLKKIQEKGNKKMGLSIEDVIEECKLFYFAGSETTSNLLVWTVVMLAKHQDWQDRAREEVFKVFGEKEPTDDGLSHLKTVTMIFSEVLRMYPPVPFIVRAPIKTVKLGNMIIPAGVQFTLLIGLMHHDRKIWGDDVNEFRPERFAEGVANAANTQYSFIPFASGPRVCVGQNFAMMEAKMALALMLQRYSFELSPSYRHAPFPIMTLQPQFGAPMILHKLISSYFHNLRSCVTSGKQSFIWFCPSPRINIVDPELIKEILMKPAVFKKPRPDPIGETIVGGLLFLEDDKWAAGAEFTLLIGLLHHDRQIWGDDVNEFRPERFSEGVSSAANTQFSFIPFSSGPPSLRWPKLCYDRGKNGISTHATALLV